LTVFNEFVDDWYMDYSPEAVKWFNLLVRRHPETYHHSIRVAMLAEKIAEPLKITGAEKDMLVRGCFMHDIGKTMIPRAIIEQRGPLTEAQWRIIKLHPVIGAELVEVDPAFGPGIADIVRWHHERWDGRGYPDGLKGKEIPYKARICAVVDAFDSMTSDRHYRERKLTMAEAKLELHQHRETQFDPEVVDALMELSDEMLNIYSIM